MKKPTINGETQKLGIIGHPLKHTLSPLMHNGLFAKNKINAFYFPLEINPNNFSLIAPSLKYIFQGFNVTVPFKEKIIPFLDFITDESKQIGAVNTVYLNDGRVCGANTDWIGFAESLEQDYNISFDNKQVLILGAGGSSRACFYAALWKGASKITICNRTLSKAQAIIKDSKCKSTKVKAIGLDNVKVLNEESSKADIIINSTSIGLSSDNEPSLLNFKFVQKNTFVYDLIYSHPTQFLKDAKKHGLSTGNGKGMLLRQGAHAFQFWTGIFPNIKDMAKFAGFKKYN